MNIHRRNKIGRCAGVIFLGAAIMAGCGPKKEKMSAGDNDSVPAIAETEQEEETSEYPEAFLALMEAYPDKVVGLEDNQVIMANGDRIEFDDGKEKDHVTRLDDSDIEDMFYEVYRLPDPAPAYLSDVGRSRSEKLFKSMYGNSSSEVQKNLVPVEWFGEKVRFTSVNGASDSLKAVAKEISLYPELKPYLKSSGTFYWRPVRGANRLSAHSYGIAFDIAVDKSDYWLWKSGSNDEMKKVEYSNRIPRQLVEIFQKHGFIWGGAWYHFDTMHFEFRPELLNYAARNKK